MTERAGGFDWDEGNREKCQRHGVSIADIESLFDRPVMIMPDAVHSRSEARLLGIGRSERGRRVFVVFTFRNKGGQRLIRPISARYMHRKEIDHYEKENPEIQD